LGFAPPSNAYLNENDLKRPETYYPLNIKVCENCWLVQTEDYAEAHELFKNDYAYFSSTSSTWLDHARKYSTQIIEELGLGKNSFVIEIASNDGYLLKNFVEAQIPCVGIEPTASTANEAERQGVPVVREFFGEALAERMAQDGEQGDLIIGNNVFAHVPDINDFTRGLKAALKQGGIITLEFPHLMKLLEQTQFDTIYHEHFSYLSLNTVNRIFNTAGLRIWKVEKLPTHGGSLRIYGCHIADDRETHASFDAILKEEQSNGLQAIETYLNFQSKVYKVKDDLLTYLIDLKRNGKKVAAYGAAAKGNTLINYAGIKPDLLPCVFDAAASKQGKYMPGSHIPILAPEQLSLWQPDFILILPWNIADEVQQQIKSLIPERTRFFIAIPELRML
jgi:SAM-dependent methyltransferase